jgi:RNA polymerase sigma-70 factor (family 1)
LALNPLYDEKALLQKMAEGDEKAFEEIYKQYRDHLYNFTLKFVKSPELADDLTQEVFIRVWEHHRNMIKIESFRGYLFSMCRNHTLNFLNKASRENAAKGEMLRHYKKDQPSADDKLLSEEYRQFIKNTLDSLSPQTREIFRLCREEHRSYDEVAALLGISRNAVKKHMVRSHKTFKDRLGNDTDIPISILLLLLLR